MLAEKNILKGLTREYQLQILDRTVRMGVLEKALLQQEGAKTKLQNEVVEDLAEWDKIKTSHKKKDRLRLKELQPKLDKAQLDMTAINTAIKDLRQSMQACLGEKQALQERLDWLLANGEQGKAE